MTWARVLGRRGVEGVVRRAQKSFWMFEREDSNAIMTILAVFEMDLLYSFCALYVSRPYMPPEPCTFSSYDEKSEKPFQSLQSAALVSVQIHTRLWTQSGACIEDQPTETDSVEKLTERALKHRSQTEKEVLS